MRFFPETPPMQSLQSRERLKTGPEYHNSVSRMNFDGPLEVIESPYEKSLVSTSSSFIKI